MSEDEAFRLVHTLSLFLFMAGLGGTLLPLYRAWGSADVMAQAHHFQAADRSQVGVLLPGLILTGVTGLIWAIRSEVYDPVETGWLLAVEGLYLFALFVCFPAMAAGLRRARILALQAFKTGKISAELEETLADRGPIVVGTLLVPVVALMTALAVVKPF